MKKQIHDEKEILDFVAKHTFEDRKNNLEAVKMRLGLDDVKQKRLKARFKRARLCYALGCLSLLFGVGLYGGYRYLLESFVAKSHYISTQIGTNFYKNMQSEQFLHVLNILILGSFIISVLLVGMGYYLKKTSKNMK